MSSLAKEFSGYLGPHVAEDFVSKDNACCPYCRLSHSKAGNCERLEIHRSHTIYKCTSCGFSWAMGYKIRLQTILLTSDVETTETRNPATRNQATPNVRHKWYIVRQVKANDHKLYWNGFNWTEDYSKKNLFDSLESAEMTTACLPRDVNIVRYTP